MGLFETLRYIVVKKYKNIEIRKYDTFLLASTRTQPNKRLDSGFMNVFNYISGHNQSNEKISMTTPVISYEEDDTLVTGFYVPSKYAKDTVPKPTDDQVFIQENLASYYAVIRFRGSWNETNFLKAEQTLLTYMKDNQIDPISSRLIFRYQPPFIPSFLRRNEIAFQIEM